MRTIAVAVALLSSCFMQEVIGNFLGATPEKKKEAVKQDAQPKVHLEEQKKEKTEEKKEDLHALLENACSAAEEALKYEKFEVARSGLDAVVKKFAARFQELNKAASQKGASDEAKKAADKAEKDLEEASETQQSFDRTFGLGEFKVFVEEDDDEEAEDDNEVSALDFSDDKAFEDKAGGENKVDDENEADDDHEAEEADEDHEADEQDEHDENDENDEEDEKDEEIDEKDQKADDKKAEEALKVQRDQQDSEKAEETDGLMNIEAEGAR